MVENIHECKESFVEHLATIDAPYHFVDSGLPNVYLAGIKYWVCAKCNKQAAEIPFLKDLMVKIANAVVRQESQLDHCEIRFLRKRLGKKSSEFAKIIGVTPAHLSRIEKDCDEYSTSESVDKLIRLYYSLLSSDETLKDIMNRHIDD